MKKAILALGKKYNIEITVISTRVDFDVTDYEVWCNGSFIGIYTFYTGRTNTGVFYAVAPILPEIEADILKYINSDDKDIYN